MQLQAHIQLPQVTLFLIPFANFGFIHMGMLGIIILLLSLRYYILSPLPYGTLILNVIYCTRLHFL